MGMCVKAYFAIEYEQAEVEVMSLNEGSYERKVLKVFERPERITEVRDKRPSYFKINISKLLLICRGRKEEGDEIGDQKFDIPIKQNRCCHPAHNNVHRSLPARSLCKR